MSGKYRFVRKSKLEIPIHWTVCSSLKFIGPYSTDNGAPLVCNGNGKDETVITPVVVGILSYDSYEGNTNRDPNMFLLNLCQNVFFG